MATRAPAKQFKAILAQAAWALGFATAKRKAFVADGAAVNWTTHKQWFSDFEAILDFIHALSYIFAAAMAGRSFGDGWKTYVAWIQEIWSGQVERVISALERGKRSWGRRPKTTRRPARARSWQRPWATCRRTRIGCVTTPIGVRDCP